MAEGDECCGRRRLKQTTTSGTLSQHRAHCISFDSYIKPQRDGFYRYATDCCISFDSYIKPQLERGYVQKDPVVYLLIPTSNHNDCLVNGSLATLYIF